MHKIAIMTFGQPRFIKEGLAWKNEYWRRVKELNPDIQIDWYYHIWDGITPNQLFLPAGPELEYYSDKKTEVGHKSWLDHLKRIPPAKIINDISQEHAKLGLTSPVFHYDMAYELIHTFYNDKVKTPFKQLVNNIVPDLDVRYNTIKGLEHYYNYRFPIDWAAPISASLAHSLIPKNTYDTIIMTRTDAILRPDSAELFANAINNTDGWVLVDPNSGNVISYHIDISTPKPCVINDIWFNDYYYLGSPKAFDVIFSDWEQKLSSMIIYNLLKHFFANNYGLYPTIGSTYNLHSVFVNMARNKKNNTIINFGTNFGTLVDNQTLFREGYNRSLNDFSNETFQKITDHFVQTQINIRPFLQQ